MDRLNQLRGDAGASRDSTLDTSTSSLLGEGYVTANDGSKYFSMSEVDSSSTDSPVKEAAVDVTDGLGSHAERIISSLSPIPKKSELDSFKIGEQIEAANILSGGVNIFDDNENSYDGDELVIDDAATGGDDKPAEIKFGDNEVTFEKSDRSPDTNMDDADAGSPSKDTEVVLQIDGKNVDAIDIGNGLYLYRKDGEEELAAVQILQDDQQPNIKFLKVRENAEGNLEVYEEIEIEVPKEVPTKEGKIVKNTSHIPIKDINKVSEPVSNRVTEKKSQAIPKDTSISEVELEFNKDNTNIESRTEVNLNGKMMKFSESRKSPLIGTFTPMTYHSTPNKEGIPLTKTMVDLQLHPNRHSENVKKTIEVHTDNCKQKLTETPTKNTKDSNEHNKASELNTSSDKDLANYMFEDGGDQANQHYNKDINQKLVENKIEKINEVNEKNYESNVKDNKTEIVNDMPNLVLEKTSTSIGATCLNVNTFNKEDDGKSAMVQTPLNETASTLNTEHAKTYDKMEDAVRIENSECNPSKSKKSKKFNDNDDTSAGNSALEKRFENVCSDSDNILQEEKNTQITSEENQDVNLVIATNTDVSPMEVSTNMLKTPESSSNNPLEKDKFVDQSQINSEINTISNVDKINTRKVEETERNEESLQINKPFETISESTKDIELAINTEIKYSETQCKQKLIICPSDMKTKSYSQFELTTSKENDKFEEIKPTQKESDIPLKNSKPADIKTDCVVLQTDQTVNVMKRLPTDQEPKNNFDLKQHESKCKKHTTEREQEIKYDMELESLDSKNKLLSVDCHSSMKPKVINIAGPNEKEIENKNKSDKISKDLSKKVDINTKQLETVPSKTVLDATKPKLSEEKALNKNSTNQSCSSQSLLPMKVNATEKEMQNKNELKLKLPIAYKNTKVALPASDLKLPNTTQNEAERSKNDTKKEQSVKVSKVSIPKAINNNKAAVPFGMWTEANRQEFLNKIKETKVPTTTSNTKQLKQPNDLNRRDILQKIDSQRQSNIASTKAQELNILNKIKQKNETTAFTNKSNVIQKEKLKDKVSAPIATREASTSVAPVDSKTMLGNKVNKEQPLPIIPVDLSNTTLSSKKDSGHRKEINNQDLIDKTIEGIINRAVTAKCPEDVKQDIEQTEKTPNVTSYSGVSLDEIESKMNELHGIPFVERPPHELPKVFENESKSSVTPDVSTASKIPSNTKTYQKSQHKANQPINTKLNEDSDEEIIEHEPVTGDIKLNKNNVSDKGPIKDKTHTQNSIPIKINCDDKKETIITENEFDKFARRNSITYENCLTVNFDGKEHHNVVQTIVEKEALPKKLSRNEIMLAESKAKSHKQSAVRHVNLSSKIPTTTKVKQDEDSLNKSYQSKVQMAYQTALTVKRQQECPITIIEDKPVKVVFMDGNHEYVPHQLNVQGKELSPPKKVVNEWDHFMHSNSESLDSDILDSGNDSKSQDDIKFKSKHQRKQVLTPVETPELELIEPGDLGINVSPKKKRKMEDTKFEKNSKSLVPKKSYLLNRSIMMEDAPSNSHDSTTSKELVDQQDVFVKHKDPISAIDNLVKAAELLETQSENKNVLPVSDQNPVVQQTTPVKRGRGRPRKYPLPDPGSDNKNPSPVKTPTPQKKPRLIDAKVPKRDTESEDDEINSDGELVKENWTMGKINENIVCPICNKLFRSEDVLFKHVKHCTGPSPSRSDSDKRSPRRLRQSQELDCKSEGSKSESMDIDEDYEINKPVKKRKSKETRTSIDNTSDDKTEVIVIEDTPIKGRDSPVRKREKLKNEQNKTINKPKIQQGTNNLVCEFCGKTFRQLSYLVNHRLQHKNTETKKTEKNNAHRSLFCEICKKEFRKLHHLVQHRIIHNPDSMRSSRKSSSEQNDGKTKEGAKGTEDQSAGFRCEPCDKSFRKLHHLVEHRETHDEIKKKCNPVTNTTVDSTKPTPLHHCDICKKTFKKLQHLIEHKEHHLDTSSEKSDDKSVQSSLSTKDIIHECSLCYMVFPNEHSLTKHHIICQRKKKQTAAKQAKKVDGNDETDVEDGTKITDADNDSLVSAEKKPEPSCVVIEDDEPVVSAKDESKLVEESKPLEQKKEAGLENQLKPTEVDVVVKPEIEIKTQINDKLTKSTNKKDGQERTHDKVSVKSKKQVPTATPVEIIKIPDAPTPKKKFLSKDKISATVTKQPKTSSGPTPVVDDVKAPDSSDDDEIRYMLNPDFRTEETSEGKLFMKVRAKKRSSLQIERPNSKDLMKRRISLQHPPKIPRLKPKPIARKPVTNTVVKSTRKTIVSPEPPVTTDSDDSDVKYSFPEPVVKETVKGVETKVKDKKLKIVKNRKSLSNIAKRKSLGKMITTKQRVNPVPVKQIKKRSAEAEHRCDCGQLFSSAALLARHATLAHTPPRIRRRRSPPPPATDTRKTIDPAKTSAATDKPARKTIDPSKTSAIADKPTRKTIDPSKTSAIADKPTRKTIDPSKTSAIADKPTRKTIDPSKTSAIADKPTRKTIDPSKTRVVTRKSSVNDPKPIDKTPVAKTRRSAAHKGVPVPEKMRKLMDKAKK